MKVNLISITQDAMGKMTPEELIVYTARVSNPKNQDNHATAGKLINFLIREKHWSPFEMVDMTVEIETSRAIAAQILRHRSFVFQEGSQRYSSVTSVEPISIRKSGAKNRQSSLEEFDPVIGHEEILASDAIGDYISKGEILYKDLLEAGVAKECARFVLPLATTTRLYMKGSARSWIHYFQVRTHETTQLEHRQVANAILSIFKLQFPQISSALSL